MPDKKPKTFGYREEVLEALLKLLAPYDDVTQDNMFGFPAFRASGQIFACVYENGISLKMPKAAAEAIVQSPGISPFIPFGRARMRQWVHIERKKTSAYIKDFPLIEASIHYVRTLKPKKSAKKTGKSPAPAPRSTAAAAGKTAGPAKASPAAKAPAKPPAKKSAASNKPAASKQKKTPSKKTAKAPATKTARSSSAAKPSGKKSAAKKKPAGRAVSAPRKNPKKKAGSGAAKSAAKNRK